MTCSPMKFTLPIQSSLKVDIEITDNPYELEVEALFDMAARINKKRAFLFVSKILGKHLPIDPGTGLITGALLADRYLETVKGIESGRRDELLVSFMNGGKNFVNHPFINEHVNPVIIGFAETATALGHAFYQFFQKADFFHTTREQVIEFDPVITFEEEHSHATSHRCYVEESILNNNREIILVDDEITTGKTAINIIRSIHERFPRKSYTVVSILDWRSEQNLRRYDDLKKELGIIIHSVSLLKGKIHTSGTPDIFEKTITETEIPLANQAISTIHIKELFPEKLTAIEYTSLSLDGQVKKIPYLKETGRFGVNSAANLKFDQDMRVIGQYLADRRTGRRSLVLGTAEFMFLPMKLASYMGDGVKYQSTTRSPIYVEKRDGYGAQYGLAFPNPDDREIAHFVYNIPPHEYDELFLFFERAVSLDQLQPFLNELKKTHINDIKVVFFNGGIQGE
ncbi:phosphoribosyltransferase family protein [Bacillus sp. FJAT-29790]|nr:phosphoribosyltransferase family protein [Bacillus sp. FJAT-29790]